MHDRIARVMAAVFKMSPGDVRKTASKRTIRSWDSLKHINLVLALEDEFKVEFLNDEISAMDSYTAIHRALAGKMKGSGKAKARKKRQSI